MSLRQFSDMLGQVMVSVETVRAIGMDGKEYHLEMNFVDENGTQYRFYHEQDCCEGVWIQDICGDLSDLVGSPLLQAEEVSSDVDENELEVELSDPDNGSNWTFYKFGTEKGSVTVRWLGEGNGNYSLDVDYQRIERV
jgi:hypothetical protein